MIGVVWGSGLVPETVPRDRGNDGPSGKRKRKRTRSRARRAVVAKCQARPAPMGWPYIASSW
eukprot:804764-Alexandrium_andersonii.AAC.1